MWLTAYPVDVVKSRMQTDGFTPETQKYKSALDCFRKTLAAEGPAAFFRGFSPVLVRAAPANAATFLMYVLTHYLGKSDKFRYEYTRSWLG